MRSITGCDHNHIQRYPECLNIKKSKQAEGRPFVAVRFVAIGTFRTPPCIILCPLLHRFASDTASLASRLRSRAKTAASSGFKPAMPSRNSSSTSDLTCRISFPSICEFSTSGREAPAKSKAMDRKGRSTQSPTTKRSTGTQPDGANVRAPQGLRRVATRYDKLARNLLAGALIAATVVWWLN
jgi:hypothetical protein